ncbi:hypothetical protein ACT2E5_27175 [Burkholderia vietnamiensis]|nr:hypothetical protein [Burkholderia vietnamiensis]
MFEIDDVPDFADPGTTTASLPVRFWGTGVSAIVSRESENR